MLPRVKHQIASLLDTDEFKQRMASRMKDPSAWNELMVLTVARSLTTQYALALVTLHLRIKLNIVSRHYLLEIAEATDGPSSLGHLGGAAKLSDLTKRRFLSMDHLLNEGLQPLALAVTDVVRAHLAPVNSLQRLTEKLNAEQSLALLAASRAALEERLLLGADDEAAEWEAASAQAVETSASRRSASGAAAATIAAAGLAAAVAAMAAAMAAAAANQRAWQQRGWRRRWRGQQGRRRRPGRTCCTDAFARPCGARRWCTGSPKYRRCSARPLSV